MGKKGYKIREVPITYEPRESGGSKVNLIRDGILIPFAMFKIKITR